MQQPNLIINWAAIATAVAAAFFFGYLWYGPLFGKAWAKAMGLRMDQKPDGKFMAKALGLQLFGVFLTAFVIAHSGQVWRPSVWNAGEDAPDYLYGAMCGIFTWIGFYVPLQFNKVTWEGKPWKVFFINVGHEFLMLQIVAQILANWR